MNQKRRMKMMKWPEHIKRMHEEEIELALKIDRLNEFINGTKFMSLRSEEHTSELQSLMRISYAVFCLKKKNKKSQKPVEQHHQQYCTHNKPIYPLTQLAQKERTLKHPYIN